MVKVGNLDGIGDDGSEGDDLAMKMVMVMMGNDDWGDYDESDDGDGDGAGYFVGCEVFCGSCCGRHFRRRAVALAKKRTCKLKGPGT